MGKPSFEVLHGNCLHLLQWFDDNSIDAVVTDPPYGLAFMGKKWDYDVPSVETWREVFRVLKPGGHLLSFGGTRTYHRMVVNIEDAGFEIRDQLQWIYGSGFPKSLDVSKAIDKAAGAERTEVVGINKNVSGRADNRTAGQVKAAGTAATIHNDDRILAPATPEAKQWSGWGTALKPANEPIVLARKPLIGTVAANVLEHGTGGLNIDVSRVGSGDDRTSGGIRKASHEQNPETFQTGMDQVSRPTGGRFPANVLFDEDAAAVLDAQSGDRRGFSGGGTKGAGFRTEYVSGEKKNKTLPAQYFNDSGGASRFFYVAKASKRERGEGNVHPTVKPVKLMEYLVRLVTPPGGTVLDPFMGSGTTGVACRRNGFAFVGIEAERAYTEIAEKRIAAND
jgi:DNA modification methylase